MEENLTCRMMLGVLKVDFMPTDATILGFTNCWYQDALNSVRSYPLTDRIIINILAPQYFIATKLEAYLGRGNDDPMGSHDLEDIINLVDGRSELLEELKKADQDVRSYIANQFADLLRHRDFDYAVQGNLQDSTRSELFFNRWEQIAALT